MRVPDLPRFRLYDAPSPLTPALRFVAALGGTFELWLKREDLLPLAFGGNKLRNLEFLVGAALADGADSLVTSGRRWSNHARLTAAAGARTGLDVHLVLSGPPASAGDGPNARVERLFGATVHQLPTDDRSQREATVERLATELRAAGRRPYVIGVGGTGPVGAFGQALAGMELVDQMRSLGGPPDLVVLPSATGGTHAGVLVGLRAAGAATPVIGIAVAKPAAELADDVARLAAGVASLLGVAAPAQGEIELDGRFLGPAYGVPTEAAGEAAELLARTEAVLVDPVYTGKALAGLVAVARSGGLDDRRVVFWHAGGTPAIFEELPGR